MSDARRYPFQVVGRPGPSGLDSQFPAGRRVLAAMLASADPRAVRPAREYGNSCLVHRNGVVRNVGWNSPSSVGERHPCAVAGPATHAVDQPELVALHDTDGDGDHLLRPASLDAGLYHDDPSFVRL